MIEDKDLEQLAHQYGAHFVEALKSAIGVSEAEADFHPLQVGEAKDHFSQVLEDVRAGHCHVVQKRSEEPVLMISIEQLSKFVDRARPRRRFAEMIAPDDALPTRAPALRVARKAIGRDKTRLQRTDATERSGSAG